MLGLAISCTTAIVNKSPSSNLEVLLDPSGQEAEAARGLIMVTCLPALGTITNVVQSGLVSADEVINVSSRFEFGEQSLTRLLSAWTSA
jgi:exosome complex component MTR3